MAETPKMTTKGQLFWNAYGNLQAGIKSMDGYDFNRELITYIQADDRYVSYVDEYLATATNLTEPKEAIRARAVAEHEKSLNTLETSPGYSTDVQGLANDFFFVIEQKYPDTPAADAAVEAKAATPDADAPASDIPAVQEDIQSAAPTYTIMGDVAMLAASTVVEEKAVTPADTTQTAETTYTAMGDVAMTAASPVVEEKAVTPADTTQTAAVDKPFDESFARSQLGELAQTPEAEVVPVTESIKPEDMPVPIVEEIKPVEAESVDPVTTADTAQPEAVKNSTPHTVKRGENLWNIAKDFYGLEKAADIQRAVDNIAAANDMGKGTAANHIKPGQIIELPDSPVGPEGTPRLNWEALDAETKKNLRSQFAAAVNNDVAVATPARVADLAHNAPAATLG